MYNLNLKNIDNRHHLVIGYNYKQQIIIKLFIF